MAYNLFVIPADMEVTKMTLKIPISPEQYGTNLTIRKLASNWKESDIDKGMFPAVTIVLYENKIPFGQKVLEVDLTIFKHLWAKERRKNNGIVLHFSKIQNEVFVEENAPYLIVETI